MTALPTVEQIAEPTYLAPATVIVRAAVLELAARAAIIGLSPAALLCPWATRDLPFDEEDE